MSDETELIARLFNNVDDRLYAFPGQWVCDTNEIINVIVAIKNERDHELRKVTAERDSLRAALDWIDQHLGLRPSGTVFGKSVTEFYGCIDGEWDCITDAALTTPTTTEMTQ